MHRWTVFPWTVATVLVTATMAVGGSPRLDRFLAQDGTARMCIVLGSDATEAETFAGQELSDHLQRMTGALFPHHGERDAPPGMPALYVGWTDHATKNGIDVPALGDEEWVLRSTPEGLILSGGRPRGTLYAVYEFLESVLGCRWLDRDTTVIPSKPTLTVASLDRRGRPAFWWRGFYGGFYLLKPDAEMREREWLFRIRNKGNAEDSPAGIPRFGFGERMGPPRNNHTFFFYVDPREWFETHPDYFADDGTGKRTAGAMDVPAYAGSSLCLSNPDVTRIVAEQLRVFIAQGEDRAHGIGAPPPRVYDISQPDRAVRLCQCPACMAIVDREGSDSGPLIAFINAVADTIRDDHPDVFVQTFAYVSTEAPPRTLSVRDNVIIRWCDLYTRSEALRPLTHPHNTERAAQVRDWSRIAKNLIVWDYGYYGSHASPDTHIHTLQPDLAFFHQNNVKGLFIEAEEQDPIQSFYALARWLGLQLMQDPHQASEPLVARFMEGYYGPAAPWMMTWLQTVEQRIADNPDRIVDAFPAPPTRRNRRHWDLDFFRTADRILEEAEQACPPGSDFRRQVRNERLPVFRQLLSLWDDLERETMADGATLPFDRTNVVDRYESIWKEQVVAQRSANWGGMENLSAQIALIRHPPALPAAFRAVRSDRIVQFFWNDLHSYGNRLVEDADAAGGRARRLSAGIKIDHAARPYTMGVYNRTDALSGPTRTLQSDEIPRDENYHLHAIGRFRLGPSTVVWTHGSWLLSCFLDRAYQSPDGLDPSVNDWDIYVSLKFTGPSYVTGSEQEDAVWMDRVILVRP